MLRKAEWLKKKMMLLYVKICPHLKPSDFFLPQKIAQRNPYFQDIPLFASSIYFTLPEIVMGPIWVPNASINTSWVNLRILIICFKTISQRSISKLIATILLRIDQYRLVSASLLIFPYFCCSFLSGILKF